MNSNYSSSPTDKADSDEYATDATASERSPGQRFAAAFFFLLGSVGALLGSRWIYVFGFTNYRAHLSYVGLPLGIGTLIFSLIVIWFGLSLVRSRLNRHR